MIKFILMQALIQEECQDDEFPVEQAEVGWREEGGGWRVEGEAGRDWMGENAAKDQPDIRIMSGGHMSTG